MLEKKRTQWQLSLWGGVPKQSQSSIKGLVCAWRVISLQSSWIPKNLGSIISKGMQQDYKRLQEQRQKDSVFLSTGFPLEDSVYIYSWSPHFK